MYELVFATHNKNKRLEIQAMVSKIALKDLDDIGINEEIPENEPNLEGNALTKARYVKNNCGLDCFADDTGLEVEALNGEPGVYSARYAGDSKSAEANMKKLLQNLEGVENRKARFRTVIALIQGEKEHLFEGIVEGHILVEKRGNQGFGYDPIFVPDGYSKTFAEMDMDQKNTISHRKRAVQKLVDFLQES